MRAARGVPDPLTGSGTRLGLSSAGEYTEPEEASTLFGGCLRFLPGTIAEGPSALSSRVSMTSPQTEPVQLSKRPRRADALRNYEALLAAAREAFTESDRSASLEDIARRAGVGIGTLYRNFPTRQDLFEAVYVEEVNQLSVAAEAAAALPPWEALQVWLKRFVEYVATKRAVIEALNRDSDMFRACRATMYAAGEPLLTRAQQSGEVRADASFDDVVRLVSGLMSAAFVDETQRDRVLTFALDGIRNRP
jgi:AcrR family transcriptional regulator